MVVRKANEQGCLQSLWAWVTFCNTPKILNGIYMKFHLLKIWSQLKICTFTYCMHSDYGWFLLKWFETNLQTSKTKTTRSKANRAMERKIKFKQNKNDGIWHLSLSHFYLPHLELVKFKIRGHDGQLIKVTIKEHHYTITTLNGSIKIKTKIKYLANNAYGHFRQNYCDAHFEHP